MGEEHNGWNEWKNQVLEHQKKTDRQYEKIEQKLDVLSNSFLTFKTCMETKQNTGKDFFSRLLAIASLTIAVMALLLNKLLP